MRLVLDTNVVASALLWGGIPRELLQAARQRRIALFTSAPLLAELADVLGRRKFAQKVTASGFTAEQLVERYALQAAPVHPEPIPRTVRDPDDDAVLATALAARADVIATGDKDLRVLHPWRGISILNAGEALRHALGTDEQIRG